MDFKPLKTGVAYHGNRMPSHFKEDIKKITDADMDIVLHMFSHVDLLRHSEKIKELTKITSDSGLESWIDCWGLSGPPGDASSFLCYHPECHMYYSNSEMIPNRTCLNQPAFRDFVKSWIDKVAEMDVTTIFWDEPSIPCIPATAPDKKYYACHCPRCQKLFEEKYNHKMPQFLTPETEEFRLDTIRDYLKDVTDYAHSAGLKNAVCVMLGNDIGINLSSLQHICSLPNLNNIGSDPYWYSLPTDTDPYGYVLEKSKINVELADKFGKDHNLWIQTYGVPKGREKEIISASEGAYDAGARTIFYWGFNGSESNDYSAQNPERTWFYTSLASKRIKQLEYDRILSEKRKIYLK